LAAVVDERGRQGIHGKASMFESNSSFLLIAIVPLFIMPFAIKCAKNQKDGLEHSREIEKYALQAGELLRIFESDKAQKERLLVNCAHMLIESPPVAPESKRRLAYYVIATVIGDEHVAEGVPIPKLGNEMNHAVTIMIKRILITEQEEKQDNEVQDIHSVTIYSDKYNEMSEPAKEFIFKLSQDDVASAVIQASNNWIEEQKSSAPDAKKQAFREFIVWWGTMRRKGADVLAELNRSQFIAKYFESISNEKSGIALEPIRGKLINGEL
jgi:hypothetical protein